MAGEQRYGRSHGGCYTRGLRWPTLSVGNVYTFLNTSSFFRSLSGLSSILRGLLSRRKTVPRVTLMNKACASVRAEGGFCAAHYQDRTASTSAVSRTSVVHSLTKTLML